MIRLELGLPAELIDLVEIADVTLSRAQWLALGVAGITSADAVRQEQEQRLTDILGSKALAVKLREVVESSTGKEPMETLQLPVPTE